MCQGIWPFGITKVGVPIVTDKKQRSSERAEPAIAGFHELTNHYVAIARACRILVLDKRSRMQYLESVHRRRVSRRENTVEAGVRAKFVVFFSVAIGTPDWPVPKLGRWATGGDLDSGTSNGAAFGAISAGVRYSGEECRNRSFSDLSAMRKYVHTIEVENPTKRRLGEEEMETKRALPGPGLFQWNTAAWFGVQLCLTGWMLVGAVAFVRRAPEVAGIWLARLALGSWIWWRRDRFRPYPALQALLLTCLVTGIPALVALYTLRPGLDFPFIRPTGI
jgi:hypothetical protein